MFPVFFDEIVQRVTVGHPSQKTRVLRKRDDWERLNTQMAFEALGVIVQKSVDKTEQLHDTLVLTNIFVSFHEIGVCHSIAASQGHLTRSLFGRDDYQHPVE